MCNGVKKDVQMDYNYNSSNPFKFGRKADQMNKYNHKRWRVRKSILLRFIFILQSSIFLEYFCGNQNKNNKKEKKISFNQQQLAKTTTDK